MNLTDPVADFLTRIRNSIRSRHQKLDVPQAKLKIEIARILKEEGYIANYKATEENGLKGPPRLPEVHGPNNEAVIRDLKRVSRPGCRVYLGRDEIPPRSGRPRHLHPHHAQGCDDWPSGPPRRRWRRDSLRSLVKKISQVFAVCICGSD